MEDRDKKVNSGGGEDKQHAGEKVRLCVVESQWIRVKCESFQL